jgi:endonuclease YncB( thermonuclease family)
MTDEAFNKIVAVRGNEIDQYGRLIARVKDGRDLSVAAAETRAHAQRLGLWAQPNAVPPWNYRAALGLP